MYILQIDQQSWFLGTEIGLKCVLKINYPYKMDLDRPENGQSITNPVARIFYAQRWED